MTVSMLTKTDEASRQRLLRWLARQPDAIRIEAMGLMVASCYQIREDSLNQAERYYAALCIALRSMRQVEKGLTRKSPDHDLKAVAKITKIQAARIRAQRTKKSSPKRKRLMGMWGLVEQLRINEHLSFREIAKFLKTYKHFEISYIHIRNIWTEINHEEP
ncbi:MAG: hypothetical protein A4E57_02582 [Syntrophorhabdaceae bacterium PtaU1.Bin034]|nr:MAG: hypothetical protein A4E57_02582 [Syntrophorhabdaceae bacterium PtaU1.Bin034]